jgi:hypothetical protein
LPPLSDPLPPFPGFSWASPERAAKSDEAASINANKVLKVFGRTQIPALGDLTGGQIRLFATFSELDHYGERNDAIYIGPLLPRLNCKKCEWPKVPGPKIFASIRRDTRHANEILTALCSIQASVVCVVHGFSMIELAAFRKPHVALGCLPLDLDSLVDADLCISYGAEGTILKFISDGVPQLIAPWHVEAHMAARRIEAAGFGKALTSGSTQEIASLIENLATEAAAVPNSERGRPAAANCWSTTHAVKRVVGSLCFDIRDAACPNIPVRVPSRVNLRT